MKYDFDTVPSRRGGDSHKWNRYAAHGEDVIAAWVADMDFPAPPPVIDAVRARLEGPPMGYSDPPPELVPTVLERLQRLYNWQVEAEWLVDLPGVVPGLFGAVRSVGNVGDGVIIQAPNYHHFYGAVSHSDRTLLPLQHQLRSGRWEMDQAQLEELAGKGARCLLLCNPHNPVGRVLTRAELEAVADTCLRHDLLLCSDEIHAELVLDLDKQHIPIATLSEELAQKTITLVSPSKAFNLPGIGGFAMAVIPDRDTREAFRRTLHGFAGFPSALAYHAALAAWRDCDAWLEQLLDYLRENRDYLEREIEAMPGLTMTHVEATYLAWLDVAALGVDNPFQHFLDHGVALSEGEPMGSDAHLRLNFACPRSTLQEIVTRLRRATEAIAPAPGL